MCKFPIIRKEHKPFRINSSNNYIERNSRRTIYETTEDRFANELANGAEAGDGPFTVTFKDSVFGAEGENYVPGYAVVYANHNPHNVIAFEDSTTYDLYIAPEYSAAFEVAKDDSNKVITVTKKATDGIEDEAEKAAIEKEIDFQKLDDIIRKYKIGRAHV